MNPSSSGEIASESSPDQQLGIAELRASEARLRLVVDMVGEAIQLWSVDGRLVFANHATRSLFGWYPHDSPPSLEQVLLDHWVGKDGNRFLPSDLPAARVLASGQPFANLLMKLPQPGRHSRWIRVNGQPLLGKDGRLNGALTSASDVTELIEHERRLRHLAHYDLVTQLPNRVLLAERMARTVAHRGRSGELVAVCVLDLDGFKWVNDSFGHQVGDQVLWEVGQRLREGIRTDDTAARLGGDEFALLLSGLRSLSECEQALARMLKLLGKPYLTGPGTAIQISASIGVTLYPGDCSDPDQLLRHADQAMYQAKTAGKNQFRFYDPTAIEPGSARGALARIRQALLDGEFEIQYQPKVNCRHGRVEGAEALIRWRDPGRGLLSPAAFLPLIEQDDLIIALGEWVIGEVLCQLGRWHKDGLDLKVSVNLAARQLHQSQFPARLRDLLDQPGGNLAHLLEIEVVETAALQDANAVGEVIRACQELGVTFALDDFGTGYSSLVHLKRLTADVLKIDQTFVADMLTDAGDLAIVESVVGLASAFKRQVVAEGVESIDQVLMLLDLGCDLMQGHGLARPMGAARLEDWVRTFRPDPRWSLRRTPRPTRDYFDLLLLEAKQRAWVEDTIGLARRGDSGDPAPWLDERRSQFNAWLYGEGHRRFHGSDEFETLGVLHQSIERSADQVRALHRIKNAEQANQAERDLLAQSRELAVLMRRLRSKLVKESVSASV